MKRNVIYDLDLEQTQGREGLLDLLRSDATEQFMKGYIPLELLKSELAKLDVWSRRDCEISVCRDNKSGRFMIPQCVYVRFVHRGLTVSEHYTDVVNAIEVIKKVEKDLAVKGIDFSEVVETIDLLK